LAWVRRFLEGQPGVWEVAQEAAYRRRLEANLPRAVNRGQSEGAVTISSQRFQSALNVSAPDYYQQLLEFPRKTRQRVSDPVGPQTKY
jgi:hypothetical protein